MGHAKSLEIRIVAIGLMALAVLAAAAAFATATAVGDTLRSPAPDTALTQRNAASSGLLQPR
jgi:hypothetical protein